MLSSEQIWDSLLGVYPASSDLLTMASVFQ